MKKNLFTCFLVLLCLFLKAYSQSKEPVFVHGEIRSAQPLDSLRLFFWEHYMGQFVSYAGLTKEYVHLVPGSLLQGSSDKKVFQYTSEAVSDPAYFAISSILGDFFIDRFLVEPGDSLIFSIDLQVGKLVYMGPDAEKFNLQQRLALIRMTEAQSNPPSFHLGPGQDPSEQIDYFWQESDSLFTYSPRRMNFIGPGEERKQWMKDQLAKLPQDDPRLTELEKWMINSNLGISRKFLEILRADILGENANRSISLIKNLPLDSASDSQVLFVDYLNRMGDLKVADIVAAQSAFYPQYLLEKESLAAVYAREGLFTRLEGVYSPELYDQLVGRFLFTNYYRLPDFQASSAKVLNKIQTPFIKEGLEALVLAHQVGVPIQPLPLVDLQGNQVVLENFRGKTVLMAFWFPGCTPSKLMHERQLVKVQQEFADREDFALLSINTDPDPELWKRYLSENPSYSFGNEHYFLGGRDVHPFLKYYDIQAYPSLMLVDSQGRMIRSLRMPSKAPEMIDLINPYLKQPDSNSNPNNKQP